MSRGSILPAHMPEPWVRRGAVVETEDGRHVAGLGDAEVHRLDHERRADTAQRVVDCVNALEGARRPAEAVADARFALALALEWLEDLRVQLRANDLEHVFEISLEVTGRSSRADAGLRLIRDAAEMLGRTAEERLARELMAPAKPPPPGFEDCEACEGLGSYAGTRCPDCGGRGSVA